MIYRELVVLHDLLEREKGASEWEVQYAREEVRKLETEFDAMDEDPESMFMEKLDFARGELKKKVDRACTIRSLLDTVEETEFKLG